jgi:hypothetical protein
MKARPKSTCEATMADFDLPVAESAYATLLDASHKPRNMAADLVRPLRTEQATGAGFR